MRDNGEQLITTLKKLSLADIFTIVECYCLECNVSLFPFTGSDETGHLCNAESIE
jgi:hypothetical protein